MKRNLFIILITVLLVSAVSVSAATAPAGGKSDGALSKSAASASTTSASTTSASTTSVSTASSGTASKKESSSDSSSAKSEEKTYEDTEVTYLPETVPDSAPYYETIKHCKEQIEAMTDFRPEIVLVLGTGLGEFADSLETEIKIPYGEIDGWPDSTAPDHAGNLVFAEYKGLKLAIMQGRIHYYEGYSMPEVVIPIRVLHLLGAETVIITNSVGSLNKDFKVGEFVCVEDHISCFVPSPLVGNNIDELGPRFPGMTDIYDKELRKMVLKTGEEENIPVHSGVFVQTTGPQYETPAEIRMFRALGADTVGMSSAVEAIAAAHMGMKICDINCVTNMASGMEEEGFSEETISEESAASRENFKKLISGLLDKIAAAR